MKTTLLFKAILMNNTLHFVSNLRSNKEILKAIFSDVNSDDGV